MIKPVNNYSTYIPKTGNQAAQPQSLSLTVSPSPDNKTSGDKSKNSVDINIVSQNKEVSTTVSREQAFDRLEHKALTNAVNNVTGLGENNSGAIKPILAGKAISDSNLDSGETREALVGYSATKLQYNTAQYALDVYSNNQAETSSNIKADDDNAASTFVSLANDSSNHYIRSSLLISAGDRVGGKIDTFS